jgi:hypothetical protein
MYDGIFIFQLWNILHLETQCGIVRFFGNLDFVDFISLSNYNIDISIMFACDVFKKMKWESFLSYLPVMFLRTEVIVISIMFVCDIFKNGSDSHFLTNTLQL